MNIRYNSVSNFYKNKFGQKVIKIAVDAGFTCPNRDGKLSTKGCIFCSSKGSGDFAGDRKDSIKEQFFKMKTIMNKKWKNGKYIIYFQSFTNTYAKLSVLKKLFTEATSLPDVVGISIATRPDCIEEDLLKFLQNLNIYVCIELGFQTSKKESIKLINRCYENIIFEKAVSLLNKYNIDCVTHVILGLPYETKKDMLNTISYISSFKISGVKLQLLHILKDASLASFYYKTKFNILTLEQYVDIVISCIEILPQDIVIHRLTGDANKQNLIEPKWSLNKKLVLNSINNEFYRRNTFQGKFYKK